VQEAAVKPAEKELKADWFIRVFRLGIVGSLLGSFYFFPPFYGPLHAQLLLLRAQEPFIRSTGLQRIKSSCSEQRVAEMADAGGFDALVAVIAHEPDAGVRREGLKAARAWAAHYAARQMLITAEAIPALQAALADGATEQETKDLCEKLMYDLFAAQPQ